MIAKDNTFKYLKAEYNLAKLHKIKAYLIDLDGTTYIDGNLLPGMPQFIDTLRNNHLKFMFFTNNSSQAIRTYSDKLNIMGIKTSEHDILNSTIVTGMYLKEKGYKTIYCLGTTDFEQEISSFGLNISRENPQCVVLSFDKTLTYEKLENACKLINKGVDYIATNPDLVCPTNDGYIPDCGSMIALIHAATGKKPKIVGKPHKPMIEMAQTRFAVSIAETAIIGDRLYTDIRMGKNCGLLSILTLSGETKLSDLRNSDILPDIIIENIAELNKIICVSK